MALTADDQKDYSKVKMIIQKVYKLVPEAYRRQFRNCQRGEHQSHIEVG